MKLSGGTLTGNLYRGVDTGTDTVDIIVKNSLQSGSLRISSAGNFGLYSITNSKWLIYCNTDGSIIKINGRATQDGDGNTISSTYLKLSGGTLTGSLYGTSFVSNNNAGFYAKNVAGENAVILRMSSSNAVNIGNQSYATNIYGTEIKSDKTISTSSDKRLKHDIKLIDGRYDNLFDKLNPIIYKYNDQPDKEHIGFIAQDVLESLNDSSIVDSALVLENNDNGMLYIGYSELIGLLVKEVQELKRKTV